MFKLQLGELRVVGHTVLLASGLTDTRPSLAGLETAEAAGLVRYCPICDGYEARDKAIAVIGRIDEALPKARFLRTFSQSVSILALEGPSNSSEKEVADLGVSILNAPVSVRPGSNRATVCFAEQPPLDFDFIYIACGCDVHSTIASHLGIRCSPAGTIKVDDKQLSSVDGLYAAGDVVSDLHQICVAEAHAAIAATAIHRSLPLNLAP
jgi:thioredoxin reductase (NADPH)